MSLIDLTFWLLRRTENPFSSNDLRIKASSVSLALAYETAAVCGFCAVEVLLDMLVPLKVTLPRRVPPSCCKLLVFCAFLYVNIFLLITELAPSGLILCTKVRSASYCSFDGSSVCKGFNFSSFCLTIPWLCSTVRVWGGSCRYALSIDLLNWRSFWLFCLEYGDCLVLMLRFCSWEGGKS